MKRRTHQRIRKAILNKFKSRMSIYEIAHAAGVNWRTTELHLNYLKGRGLVAEVFTHKHLRIFEKIKSKKDLQMKVL